MEMRKQVDSLHSTVLVSSKLEIQMSDITTEILRAEMNIILSIDTLAIHSLKKNRSNSKTHYLENTKISLRSDPVKEEMKHCTRTIRSKSNLCSP